VVILVRAQSANHAYKIAEGRVIHDEGLYTNIYGQQIRWKFVEAVDCFLIRDEIKTGVEVYSCFYIAEKGTTGKAFLDKNFLRDMQEGCSVARGF